MFISLQRFVEQLTPALILTEKFNNLNEVFKKKKNHTNILHQCMKISQWKLAISLSLFGSTDKDWVWRRMIKLYYSEGLLSGRLSQTPSVCWLCAPFLFSFILEPARLPLKCDLTEKAITWSVRVCPDKEREAESGREGVNER